MTNCKFFLFSLSHSLTIVQKIFYTFSKKLFPDIISVFWSFKEIFSLIMRFQTLRLQLFLIICSRAECWLKIIKILLEISKLQFINPCKLFTYGFFAISAIWMSFQEYSNEISDQSYFLILTFVDWGDIWRLKINIQ